MFRRRPGTSGQHGEQYEVKTAAFLFARALNRTEEFHLASNVDGAGAFDDLVFRYRLREPDVRKTCFIQLKHKVKGGTIKRSSLTQMSGNFSLLKYFESFCEIKNNATTNCNLKQCGPFGNFEFVIYTNRKMESKSPLQRGDYDPVSILSSGAGNGEYIAFVEHTDTDIFGFFDELSRYQELIKELDNQLKGGTFGNEDINLKIKNFQSSINNKAILGKVKSLKANLKIDYVTRLREEVSNCDFTLYKEFLSKLKIFHSQSNEESFKGLIGKELQGACKASPSVANYIYTKFGEGFSKWWVSDGEVVWLNENSELWQEVQQNIITERKEISQPETQEIDGCGISFSEQHVQELSDAIKQSTVLNIVTNSKVRILQKLKTYQALNNLGYKNSLFFGIKSLMISRKEIQSVWPCRWSDVLVVDCDSDNNVAHRVLDILQQSADCDQGLDNSDDNSVKHLDDVLQKYQQKLILISSRQKVLCFQEKLRNISYFEDKCNITDFDEKSQKQILEIPVNFQGTNIALSTLVGTHPPESTKDPLDSNIISILLSNEDELSVGRQLDDYPKYYVPRVLQHHIYLKEDILKQTEYEITFAVSGLQAEDLKKYLPAREKIYEFVYDESKRSNNFKIVSHFYETGLSAELDNTTAYNKAGQNVNPEEVRYIILGNKNPDSEFKEIKKLCKNVHWIHVEEGSFLWRDTNCNINIIRRYIDNTKCKKYDDMKIAVEHDRTMLLVAEPGMGKTTFFSYMAHEIKKSKPSVWVLRINLNKHTNELEDTEFEKEGIDKCKMFLWGAAHSPEQVALKVTKEIFLQALEETGKMVILLDGFDEISPDFSAKVEILIRTIRDKTASKIWISSRLSCREELENIVGKFGCTLQPFTQGNQIQFLEEYWSKVTEISNHENLKTFAKELLSLCSKNFNDKNGEFTGIPLQTMMLGEAFINEVKNYCCSGEYNLPEKFNLLSLFKKFWKSKYYIYFSERNEMDTTKLAVKRQENTYVKKHVISSLISLFSMKEVNRLLRDRKHDLEETKECLGDGTLQQFGIIRDFMDGKPQFIHRCFAEYFAAKWFADNFRQCEEFLSNILFNPTYEVMRNFFDRMLAEDSEFHDSVLNNIGALKELLKKETDINTLDKGGRTALHLAASYNNPCIQQLLSFPGTQINKADEVMKWTPLKYADRTRSLMAMDILLQNGANSDDIVFTRPNAKAQEWGQAALLECASKRYKKLLDFILKCGIQINLNVDDPESFVVALSIFRTAEFMGELEAKVLNFNEGIFDIIIRGNETNTDLHHAAESGRVDIINLLLDKGMSVNVTNTNAYTPLHFSAALGHLEATKALVERGAAINYTNMYGYTPLMLAAFKGKLETFCYLTEIGADINIRDARNNTVLHSAAMSGSVGIINLLLDKGMSVNLTGVEGCTPLYASTSSGHLEATKILVERGAAINNTFALAFTPLLIAVLNNNLEIFRYLTETGADINIVYDTNTVLHVAAYIGSVDIINLLLDKGMSVNLTNREDYTPLHVSAQFGHLEATNALVERGAAINNTNKYGKTPVMEAAVSGKLETFRYLTEIGADINIRDAKNNTALHLVAHSGSVGIINLLLDKGMSVNLTNTNDSTPLDVSAEFGHLEATKSLVERGAAIKNTNIHGRTPLMTAVINSKLETFCYLTEIGADINIRDAENNTALHLAAHSGSVGIINLLLDKGMSVNLTNTNDSTPLHVSAQFGHLEATKSLVERGAAIKNTNIHGRTPLMTAVMNSKLETFRYLTEIGADINIRDANNNTALHLAAHSGSVGIINLLLDKEMSVNLTGTEGCTPLHVSAYFGHLEATKILVERGAAINNTNKYGVTPLTFAASGSNLEIVRYLTEIGADINIREAENKTVLHLAARSGSVGIINLLLDKEMSVNLTGTEGCTPLHISAEFGHLEATKALVERGAALNSTNIFGCTPLMLAAKHGKLEVFRYLTKKGADINIRDARKNTVLHLASDSGSVDIINLLLDKGISVNLTNTFTETPLHISAEFGHLEATKVLVERGAALNSTNIFGRTPIMLAAKHGKLEVSRYLMEKGADILIRDARINPVLHGFSLW